MKSNMTAYHSNITRLLIILTVSIGSVNSVFSDYADSYVPDQMPFHSLHNSPACHLLMPGIIPLPDIQLMAIVNDSEDLDLGSDSNHNARVGIETHQAFSSKNSGFTKLGIYVCGPQHKKYFIAISDLPPPLTC